MIPDNGGPAFPQSKGAGELWVADGGMTLRDYFAAKALTGMLAFSSTEEGNWSDDSKPSEMASFAYHLADAMIAARGAA